jgi:hypothetical protein
VVQKLNRPFGDEKFGQWRTARGGQQRNFEVLTGLLYFYVFFDRRLIPTLFLILDKAEPIPSYVENTSVTT